MLTLHLKNHFETMGKFWTGEIKTLLIGKAG